MVSWDADTRGKALALFTLAPFAGPALGPTVGGYMTVAGVSWRWLFWLLTMFVSLSLPSRGSAISVLCRHMSLCIAPYAVSTQLILLHLFRPILTPYF